MTDHHQTSISQILHVAVVVWPWADFTDLNQFWGWNLMQSDSWLSLSLSWNWPLSSSLNRNIKELNCLKLNFRIWGISPWWSASDTGWRRWFGVQLLLLPLCLCSSLPLHHDATHHVVQVSPGADVKVILIGQYNKLLICCRNCT